MRLFTKMIIMITLSLLLTGCGLFTNVMDSNDEIENETFVDSYEAQFKISTPVSSTAEFSEKDIVSKDGIQLVKLRDIKVTVIKTEDIPGQPAWICTLNGVLESNDYESDLDHGEIGIGFEVMLLNEAGGETGSWQSDTLIRVNCTKKSYTISASTRFGVNLIDSSSKARIDISQTKWRSCK